MGAAGAVCQRPAQQGGTGNQGRWRSLIAHTGLNSLPRVHPTNVPRRTPPHHRLGKTHARVDLP
jgi:hypothetical protein